MIDTHSHIYSEEFDNDRPETIDRARQAGVSHIILPNVDSESLPRMLKLEAAYPGYCHAAIGVHPTSIRENYETELNLVRFELERRSWVAIGEIGLDLYWDKTYIDSQIIAFQRQLEWALEFNLPVIIHVRDAFRETMDALAPYRNKGLRGIFHSFTGSVDEAREIIEFGGFLLGINGIVTFKNSGLAETLSQIEIAHLVIETDAPYLTPAPHRGKRNESAYCQLVRRKLAEIYLLTEQQVDDLSTTNALRIFQTISI